MPEGDTIHRIAAAMTPRLQGKVVREVTIAKKPQTRFASCRIDNVQALGKHLLIDFENDLFLKNTILCVSASLR